MDGVGGAGAAPRRGRGGVIEARVAAPCQGGGHDGRASVWEDRGGMHRWRRRGVCPPGRGDSRRRQSAPASPPGHGGWPAFGAAQRPIRGHAGSGRPGRGLSRSRGGGRAAGAVCMAPARPRGAAEASAPSGARMQRDRGAEAPPRRHRGHGHTTRRVRNAGPPVHPPEGEDAGRGVEEADGEGGGAAFPVEQGVRGGEAARGPCATGSVPE
mmetsp:Transcript_7970/g.19043  ORF Transcript_7970/g.19043 Transcript_7970/m.19043 type:complete len:212 (-) Transcript_7970:28-663(-)